MTTVIGIFDNISDLEVAQNRLYDKGFDNVRVVDEQRETGKASIPGGGFMSGPVGATSGHHLGNSVLPAAVFASRLFGGVDNRLSGELDTSISDEEAEFYADAVRNGGHLLIVETEDERANMAWSVMRNSNASQYNRA